MKKECAFCRNEFEAKRKTAKFCSTICRVYSSRLKGVVLGEVAKDLTKKEPPKVVDKTPPPPKPGSFRDFLKNS